MDTANESSWSPEASLAPYAMHGGDSRGRLHPEDEHAYRTPFQRDRDRVIHCTAFRRLEYKTQVFVNHEGDHYRTRLTHTLEVAQIGRSLARALGLNEDLTEAIALAHDLGHTPFGHSGEEVLNELMVEHGGFEHNAQGLRVVDVLEHRYRDFRGLNLTYEVREAFAKHSTRHDFPSGHETFPPGEQPPLEAQAVVIADEIAYDNHDLDDGLYSGILDEEEVAELAIWKHVTENLAGPREGLPRRIYWAIVIRKLIGFLVTDAIEETRRRLSDGGFDSVEAVRACPGSLVCVCGKTRTMKDELEAFLCEKFYRYFTVCRMSNKARSFLRQMFNAYLEDPRMLPPEFQKHIHDVGLHRVVCDYIAGMTDRFAQQEYRKLYYPFERT